MQNPDERRRASADAFLAALVELGSKIEPPTLRDEWAKITSCAHLALFDAGYDLTDPDHRESVAAVLGAIATVDHDSAISLGATIRALALEVAR
jgi:hypothetical protein